MSDGDYNKKLEIIPPSRATTMPRPVNSYPAIADYSPPAPVNPGGPVTGRMRQWAANRNAGTYTAIAAELTAETALVQTDTGYIRKRIEQARAYHEWQELPAILERDRIVRRGQRAEEIRELYHQIELEDLRRAAEKERKHRELMDQRTALTDARTRLVAAQLGLVNQQQAYQAQKEHGQRYYSLNIQQKIGNFELEVEEQNAVLSEYRKRVAEAASRPRSARQREEAAELKRRERVADGQEPEEELDEEFDELRRKFRA
jgi:hypothetical protein